MKSVVCLDPGAAHTGIAISREGILAEPLCTIFERDFSSLVGKLIPIINKHNPCVIVIGVPESGSTVRLAESLRDRLQSFFSGEVVLFEESISSKEARQILFQIEKSTRERKQREHMTAAAVILQRYLDQSGLQK